MSFYFLKITITFIKKKFYIKIKKVIGCKLICVYFVFFNRKFRRAVEEQAGSFPLDDLHATQFDLKNGTHHNQALIHWSGNNSKVIKFYYSV